MKRTQSALCALAFSIAVLPGCGSKPTPDNNTAASVTTDSSFTGTQATTTDTNSVAYEHHSVVGGALLGAAAGHALGKHAIAGAAVGALVQHERNKHEATGR
jgi:hypothetical protein